jgi:hypothetical protein
VVPPKDIFTPISKFIPTFEMGVFFLNPSFYGNFIPIIVFHIITFLIYPFSISRPNKMDPKPCIVIFKNLFFLYLITFSQFLCVGQPNSHMAFYWLSCVCAFILLLERAQIAITWKFSTKFHNAIIYKYMFKIWWVVGSLCGYFPICVSKRVLFGVLCEGVLILKLYYYLKISITISLNHPKIN